MGNYYFILKRQVGANVSSAIRTKPSGEVVWKKSLKPVYQEKKKGNRGGP